MELIYNPDNSVGNKWEMVREYFGNASITFAVSDVGQVSFSTSSISGTGHQGWISFSASTLSQT